MLSLRNILLLSVGLIGLVAISLYFDSIDSNPAKSDSLGSQELVEPAGYTEPEEVTWEVIQVSPNTIVTDIATDILGKDTEVLDIGVMSDFSDNEALSIICDSVYEDYSEYDILMVTVAPSYDLQGGETYGVYGTESAKYAYNESGLATEFDSCPVS